MEVVIVGGSIGGLTLGLLLHRAGIPSRIYEATADIRDSLRDDNDRLDATVSTRATPRRGGTTVGVELCVDAADQWQAGTFGGTVTIDGPRLKRFAYPMVVTKKWPWWSAFFLILLIVGGYILYAWGRAKAPSVRPDDKGWWRTKFVYFGVSDDSPVPMRYTGLFGRSIDCARSADVMISAPPPSVTRQHSSRCIG